MRLASVGPKAFLYKTMGHRWGFVLGTKELMDRLEHTLIHIVLWAHFCPYVSHVAYGMCIELSIFILIHQKNDISLEKNRKKDTKVKENNIWDMADLFDSPYVIDVSLQKYFRLFVAPYIINPLPQTNIITLGFCLVGL